jgi:TatD DNase family protein
VLDACLARGLYIGLGSLVTRGNAQRAQRAATTVPGERLLLETDAPYMAQDGVPPGQTEPTHLRAVLAAVARLRGEEAEETAMRAEGNVATLFIRKLYDL